MKVDDLEIPLFQETIAIWKIALKWMMTGGISISGHLHHLHMATLQPPGRRPTLRLRITTGKINKGSRVINSQPR